MTRRSSLVLRAWLVSGAILSGVAVAPTDAGQAGRPVTTQSLEQLARAPMAPPKGPSAPQQAALRDLSAATARGEIGDIERRWAAFLNGLPTGAAAPDISALVQWVLREGYLQQNANLQFYADKVKGANDRKEALPAEIARLRKQLATAKAGDDAQLAHIDLQNALQKQQTLVQTMANVSKMMFDTAMSTIRKIG